MTIEEAESFYKKYHGRRFHMGREEWGRYKNFEALELPEEYFRRWDTDLLNDALTKMQNHTDDVWMQHWYFIDLLFHGYVSYELWIGRLLDAMDTMTVLGPGDRTHLIRNMAGGTESMKDGGVYLICTKTKQAGRMKEVMEKLMANDPHDQNFRHAVDLYQKALKRYCRI